MELRQYLKLTQQLVMTPQLQQAIKLLQLSRMELNTMVREQLMENPVLEETPEAPEEERKPQLKNRALESAEEPIGPQEEKPVPRDHQDLNWESFVENYENYSYSFVPTPRYATEDLPSIEQTYSKRSSLFDHLMWQLRLSNFIDIEETIGALIIGNISDDGYLRIELEEIAEEAEVGVDEVEDMLTLIQEFDPIGVGARDLKECLLLQARYLYPANKLVETIIGEHLEDLERRSFTTITRSLKISMEDVAKCARIISQLEPKPGRSFATEDVHYITPDIYVQKVGDEYVTMLNEDGLPKLKISSYYRSALAHHASQVTKDYIQERFRSAVWLIRSIHQRQSTIRKVTESIVKFQSDFLDRGISHLRPLILRDVAEDIGMHESTISRVTTNKYVHTPQGIFELKYFFNSRISRTTGEDLASESVKNKIKLIIEDEDTSKPYSDQKIANMLQNQSIEIARRTVAKYREMLGILSSSKRKKLF